jgi:hypothetical protein
MDVSVGLSLGDARVTPLSSKDGFKFRVADKTIVGWTFWTLLVLFIVACGLLLNSPALLRDVPGGTYSLAKTQMAFWALIVALCFVGVWFVVGAMEEIPDSVLILLGISGATSLLSAPAGQSSADNAAAEISKEQARVQAAKTTAQATQQPFTEHDNLLKKLNTTLIGVLKRSHLAKSESFLRDICSDGNGLSVHRMQAAAWTLILGVVFVCDVVSIISMPDFSTNLLLLMGISNGTYLTLKTREQPTDVAPVEPEPPKPSA